MGLLLFSNSSHYTAWYFCRSMKYFLLGVVGKLHNCTVNLAPTSVYSEYFTCHAQRYVGFIHMNQMLSSLITPPHSATCTVQACVQGIHSVHMYYYMKAILWKIWWRQKHYLQCYELKDILYTCWSKLQCWYLLHVWYIKYVTVLLFRSRLIDALTLVNWYRSLCM